MDCVPSGDPVPAQLFHLRLSGPANSSAIFKTEMDFRGRLRRERDIDLS